MRVLSSQLVFCVYSCEQLHAHSAIFEFSLCACYMWQCTVQNHNEHVTKVTLHSIIHELSNGYTIQMEQQ